MERINSGDIVRWTGGKPINLSSNFSLSSIITDSRERCNNSLFIALKGKNFDGHDFIEDAMKKKCRAVVVEKPIDKKIPQIVVKDTLKAFGDIAKYYRKRFSCPVIGIAGSDGKTTTKELISSFLLSKYKVVSNTGNFNNEIGLPMSVLKLDKSSDIGVFELGMNGAGQLKYLGNILQPDVSVITSIGLAHAGFFKNRSELVYAKCELLQKTKNLSVVNGDTGFNSIIEGFSMHDLVFFGMSRNNGFRGRYVKFYEDGFDLMVLPWKEIFYIPFWNGIFTYSVLAALFIGGVFSSERKAMKDIISEFKPLEGRGKISKINGIKIFDDSYNANPVSVKSALFYFSRQPGKRKIAILGSMAELGGFSGFYHKQIGRYITKLPIGMVLTVGEDARFISALCGKKSKHFDTREQLETFLSVNIKKGDNILIKGSRINHLDKTVQFLKEV